jgi:hypothetical protein
LAIILRVKTTRKSASANPKPAPTNLHPALERLVGLLARRAAREYILAGSPLSSPTTKDPHHE